MKKLMFAVGASCALFLMGCGGGDVCSTTSKCSAQPKPTQAQIDQCKAATASGVKCASQYTTLANCAASKEVCAADNTTDGAATIAACSTESTAYATCLQTP
jgi:hypothetical protein